MSMEREGSGDIVVRIPHRDERPYEPLRNSLYSAEELMAGWDTEERTLDEKIGVYYAHEGGQSPKDASEALCQRIHDDYIDRLVRAYLSGSDEPAPKARKLVGIMGGHAEDRTSKYYIMVAEIAYHLTQAGYSVVTGGGPGVMEAGNLGAYMSGYTVEQLHDAVATLSKAPSYPQLDPLDPNSAVKRKRYVEVALMVRQRYQKGTESLGVPTWAYADEPTGQFASHIAKYFANSIREDGLLAIAAYGVIFGPGAAGTSQEIFQDAAHNSYWSFNSRGPMVFLGPEAYRRSPSLYDVALAAANRDGYSDFLALVDDASSAVAFIQKHPLIMKPGASRTVGLSQHVYPL